jgi:hypothetical protein
VTGSASEHRQPRALMRGDVIRKREGAAVVEVDASWRDGWAGLGVAGERGTHSRLVMAKSSLHAEMLALDFAMEWVARPLTHVMFLSDCRSAVDWARGKPRHGEHNAERGTLCALRDHLAEHPGWRVEYVLRELVADAHAQARAERACWNR